MKIGIVYLGVFPPKSGGSGGDRRVRDITRGIAFAGHDINMFIPRRLADETTLIVDDIKVRYLGQGFKKKTGKVKSRLSFWKSFRKIILEENFDWVLIYGGQLDALRTIKILKRQGVNIAAEFCDLRSVGWTPKNIKDWINWLTLKADEALIPRHTDLNIVISKYLEDHCLKRAADTKLIRIPVLVDQDLFTPSQSSAKAFAKTWNIPKNSIVFSYVGGLWKTEGVGYLVKAFAKVVKSHPNARLVIAGRLKKTDNHDDIEALVKQYKLENHVITPGWVSTDVVVGIYSRSDVLVLPQIDDEFAVAALPTKLAEYSNVGKAIIATRVGDVPLYFTSGENALLVESENIEALSTAMDSLITDKELRLNLAKGAKGVAVKHFDFRKAGTRISQAMEQVTLKVK